ncbi:hypothetical protein ACFX2C_039296 [Malus domestica]
MLLKATGAPGGLERTSLRSLSAGSSVLNAIVVVCSENLPVICIIGGMNSNDYGTSRILHHTIGLPDFTQELQCFQTVTYHLSKRLRVVLQTIDHGDSEGRLAFESAAQYDGEGNKLFDPRPHTVSLLEFGAVEDGTQGDGTLPRSKMLMEIPRKAKDEITVCCQ